MDCLCSIPTLRVAGNERFVCSSLLSKTDWRSSIAFFHDMKQSHGFEVPPGKSTAYQHIVREDIGAGT